MVTSARQALLPPQLSPFTQEHIDFRVDVPEGKSGLWEVRRSTMTLKECEIENVIGYVMKTDRFALPGTFTQLVRWGRNGNPYDAEVFMSDHHCEVADHEPLIAYARSRGRLRHVLVNGLGLGVAIELLMPFADRVTLVENSHSVIQLVAPHYLAKYGDRVEIIYHDALTYKPPRGTRYDAVFHDIWPTITHKNLDDMRLLHRKYGRICDWQLSWARTYCEQDLRKRRRNPDDYKNELDIREVRAAAMALLAPSG